MGEPSVFSQRELTLPKDTLHAALSSWDDAEEKRESEAEGLPVSSTAFGVPHGLVHNCYGRLLHEATFQGLKSRNRETQRPFVLTR